MDKKAGIKDFFQPKHIKNLFEYGKHKAVEIFADNIDEIVRSKNLSDVYGRSLKKYFRPIIELQLGAKPFTGVAEKNLVTYAQKYAVADKLKRIFKNEVKFPSELAKMDIKNLHKYKTNILNNKLMGNPFKIKDLEKAINKYKDDISTKLYNIQKTDPSKAVKLTKEMQKEMKEVAKLKNYDPSMFQKHPLLTTAGIIGASTITAAGAGKALADYLESKKK